MNDKIIEALGKLDVTNNEHWTNEGLPRLDVMKELTGEDITRDAVTQAVKDFTRENPSLEQEDSDPDETEKEDEADDETENEPIKKGSDAAIEKELKASLKKLHVAQKRYQAATTAMDEVIERREKEAAGRSGAFDVKAYQESQRKQREAVMANRKVMEKMFEANKDKV